MRGGDLRDPIAIRRHTEVQTDTGDYAGSWQDIARPFAKVEALSGRESMIAHAVQGVEAYRITIRWRAGILTSDQITLRDNTVLNIQSMGDPDGRRRELVILAESGSAEREAS